MDRLTVEQIENIAKGNTPICYLVNGGDTITITSTMLCAQLADTMRLLEVRDSEVDYLDDEIKRLEIENERLCEALKAVDEAYCGVGDFEGTGENMTSVIVQAREALSNKDSDNA